MKTLLQMLALTSVIGLSACLSTKGEDQGGKYCALYVAGNGAAIHFDDSALGGKQFQLKADGFVVYDTCLGGPQWNTPGHYYWIYEGVISHTFDRNLAKPTGETLELLTSAQCTDPFASMGTATVNYTYTYHPVEADCLHDYYEAEVNAIFQ